MDITRDKSSDIATRKIIGETLIRLRRDSGISAPQFCEMLGMDSKSYAELENGTKTMNVTRWMQSIATLGGSLTLTMPSGEQIRLEDIAEVRPMGGGQIESIKRMRSASKEKERRHREAVAFFEAITPSEQKTDEPSATPSDKKRRPRIQR